MGVARDLTKDTDTIRSSSSRGVPNWVVENFATLERGLNGQKASAMHALRSRALELFKKHGFPGPKSEDWKYTNLRDLAERSFRLSSGKSSLSLDNIRPYLIGGEFAPRVVFVDGVLSGDLSNIELGQSGIKGIEVRKADYSDFRSESEHPLIALNTSFVSDALSITAGANQESRQIIHLLFVASGKEKDIFVTPRIIVNVGSGAGVDILESHVGLNNGAYFTSPLIEINVEANGKINYYKLGLESQEAYHLGNLVLRQERDSRSDISFFSFGGQLVRNEARITLDGENCHAAVNALTVTNGTQHVDNHTVIDHAKPHSESRERIKGIYDDKAKGVFNGTIIVREDAQKTNAFQSNQTILLSNDASIDTKPQLKIWADDVRCTHGATVGQLDETALFYLRSRGIGKVEARNLLINAFASEVINEVRHEELKTRLSELLIAKLGESR